MTIHPFLSCPSCVFCDSILISKASKTIHKILKIYELAGGALLFLARFFSSKTILLNLQITLGLVAIHAAYVENWHLDTDCDSRKTKIKITMDGVGSYLTIREIAQELDISEESVHDLIKVKESL